MAKRFITLRVRPFGEKWVVCDGGFLTNQSVEYVIGTPISICDSPDEAEYKVRTVANFYGEIIRQKFEDILERYDAECASNGGHEGSVESHTLLAKLQVLSDLYMTIAMGGSLNFERHI